MAFLENLNFNLLDMKFYEIKGLENPKEPLEIAPNAKQHFAKAMLFWDTLGGGIAYISGG